VGVGGGSGAEPIGGGGGVGIGAPNPPGKPAAGPGAAPPDMGATPTIVPFNLLETCGVGPDGATAPTDRGAA